jgi:hypothetical protein
MQKNDIKSNIELLIGLKLFDTDQISEEEKEGYQSFFNESKSSASNQDLIRKWACKFLPEPIKRTSKKITRLITSSSLILIILSFIIGITAAGVLFQYDGSSPINVLPILTIFILFPLLFLIGSLLLPTITNTDTSLLSPLFHWIESKASTYVSKYNEKYAHTLNNEFSEYELIYNEPVILFFKKTLQKCATFYVVGALVWMIVNVTTTDLAFSWSSTLELEGEKIYSITSVMSAPWSWILPSATVDFETVQSTRFFRADRSDLLEVSSGRWWSFIFMSIIVYSIFPRVFLYAYYKSRLKRRLIQSMIESDQGHTILKISDEKLIVESPEGQNSEIYSDSNETITAKQKTKSVCVLIWYVSNINDEKLSEYLNRNIISINKISGISPTKDDTVIAQNISNESIINNNTDIIVFVKYWESPNIRFEKVLTEIINHSKSRIKIIPLYEDPSQLNSVNESNWRTRMASLNQKLGSKRIFLEESESVDINGLL